MLGLVMLFWAGNSIVGRAVRFDIPPFTLAFVRWAGALLLVAPFAIASLRRDWSAILRGWKAILVLGILGVGAFNALLYLGLHHTTATNALLLQAAIPALVVILDRVIFRTRPSRWQTAGVALSTIGVLAIVFAGDPRAMLSLQFGFGDTLILAAVVVWALYTVLLRLRPEIAQVSFIAATFAIGVLTMGPLAVAEWEAGQTIIWNRGVFAAFAYVAVLPSLVAYLIYNAATAQIGPARAGQAITLNPLFGALLSSALLGEKLHSYHFAGMLLILGGIGIGALALRRQDPAGVRRDQPLEERA